jgi:hypothetical protein
LLVWASKTKALPSHLSPLQCLFFKGAWGRGKEFLILFPSSPFPEVKKLVGDHLAVKFSYRNTDLNVMGRSTSPHPASSSGPHPIAILGLANEVSKASASASDSGVELSEKLAHTGLSFKTSLTVYYITDCCLPRAFLLSYQ